MSTSSGSSNKKPPGSNDLANVIPPPASPKEAGDQQNAHLTESTDNLARKLSKEQDDRKEERFYWVFAMIILFDVITFPALGKFTQQTLIFTLEIIFLIGLAKYLGVDAVVQLLENLFNRLLHKQPTTPTP